MASDAPIGVFDSGIGGLTVARAIMRSLPHESIVYFGDTARLPYGPKGAETVQRYSREVAQFLRSEGVKALVVACNTATAHALPLLQDEFDFPVVGVIQPGARAAARATRSGRVGVIATAGTVASGAYERAIRAESPNVTVTARACPLFVPLVEEGWLDTEATRLIAEEYLAQFTNPSGDGDKRESAVDTLVLGCTHYPLLTPIIGETLGRGVRLVDSASETAAELAWLLQKRGIAARTEQSARYRFIASDSPERFLSIGQRFLGAPIDRVELHSVG
jgi:glutamate racemase